MSAKGEGWADNAFIKQVHAAYARLAKQYGWDTGKGQYAKKRRVPRSREEGRRWDLERWLMKKEERDAVTAAKGEL